jgi:cytidylate kinase
MSHKIIAISREYGSGGLEIATKLAERMGVPIYNKNITDLAAEKSGIQQSYFERVDEQPTDSFLYTLAVNAFSVNANLNPYDNALSSDKLFNLQADVIREIAEKGDSVIVGRCANYILRDDPGCVSIFITAPIDFRLKRIMESENLNEKDARKLIETTDKKRDSYVKYYAGYMRRNCTYYDMVINSGVIGIDKTVEMIEQYLALRFR